MKILRKAIIAFGVSSLALGLAMQVKAAVRIEHPEQFKVTAEGHEAAMKEIKDLGIDLTNSPVPIENITTDIPQEVMEISRAAAKQLRSPTATPKNYRVSWIDPMVYWAQNLAGQGLVCDYLVPTGYVGKENAVMRYIVPEHGTSQGLWFNFYPHGVVDTGRGGIGAGGWYWRQFMLSPLDFRFTTHIWLSAADWNDLVYGHE